MPKGKGTYGSKVGRPPEKEAEGYRHGGPVNPSYNAMNRRKVIHGMTGDDDVISYLGGYNKGGLVKPTSFSKKKGILFQDGKWSPGVKRRAKEVKERVKEFFSEGSKQRRKQNRNERKQTRLKGKIERQETKLKNLKKQKEVSSKQAVLQKMNYTKDVSKRILSGDKSVNVRDLVKAYSKPKKKKKK